MMYFMVFSLLLSVFSVICVFFMGTIVVRLVDRIRALEALPAAPVVLVPPSRPEPGLIDIQPAPRTPVENSL
jgi:hypothetical protein